ncbi:MAG TPA: adenylate kinase [Candidatus Eremiobacteraceae bacterium]|jgi:adenylate kinase|nr:adenylate kinase [Candidatus Eremiobacteraceae bacterium]
MTSRRWRLVLLGPPGVGKGTQGKLLAQAFRIPQIGTGDIFRNAVKERTPMGIAAKSYVDAGKLVPDDVTIGLIEERLASSDAQNGFVLDGFPRTTQQATALDAMMHRNNHQLDGVIEIKVDPAEVLRRLTGRRLCAVCQTLYHLESAPTRMPGVCDRCAGPLIQRPDDDKATVLKRLDEYQRKTAPLAEYYGGSGLLRVVDGNGDVDKIFNRIITALQAPVGPTV